MRHYTPEQRAWIAERYADMTNVELAEAFNERFGADVTRSVMCAYGANHNLQKSAEAISRMNRKYTDEQMAFLRGYIPGHTYAEIADAFSKRFGVILTKSKLTNLKTKLGVRSRVNGGRFEMGHVPHNKGRTWDEYGTPEGHARSRATCFKPGHLAGSAAERLRPLLDIRETKDGYLQIKVAPRNAKNTPHAWLSLAKFEWMAANGRDWPEGHRAVFADRDRRNFDPDNIVPVPDELYSIVTGGANGAALPWYDRKTLEVAITHARVIRERVRLERAPRPCGCCGKTFAPEYSYQRTCRACLDAGLRAPKRKPTTRRD